MKKIIAVAAFCAVASLGSAQTVTCDASNGAPDGVTTFNNLYAACASFHDGGTNFGNAAANVINCAGVLSLVNGGPGVGGATTAQLGRLDITTTMAEPSLTFNGPATIILDSNVPTTDDGSICFMATTPTVCQVTFNDLTFLPDAATVPADPEDGFQQGPGDALYAGYKVIFNDCVLTSNDGSDQPSTATGTAWKNPTDVSCGDDWIFVNGDPGEIGLSLELNGTLITHCEDDAIIAGGKDFICRNTVSNKTRIIYNGGRGVQLFNATLDIQGEFLRNVEISYNGSNPTTADAFGNEGISNLTPGSFVANTLTNVDFIGNGEAITWIAGGVQDAPLNFTNCTFAFNRSNFQGGGINMVSDVTEGVADTITSCTFHDQQDNSGSPVEEAIVWGEGTDTTSRTLTVVNTIISGAGDTAIRVSDNLPGPGGIVTVSNSSIVQSGPDAVATVTAGAQAGTLVVLTGSVISADPQYIASTSAQVSDPQFLFVGGAAYATAGQGGAPLAGSKVYVPGASVTDWAVY